MANSLYPTTVWIVLVLGILRRLIAALSFSVRLIYWFRRRPFLPTSCMWIVEVFIQFASRITTATDLSNIHKYVSAYFSFFFASIWRVSRREWRHNLTALENASPEHLIVTFYCIYLLNYLFIFKTSPANAKRMLNWSTFTFYFFFVAGLWENLCSCIVVYYFCESKNKTNESCLRAREFLALSQMHLDK